MSGEIGAIAFPQEGILSIGMNIPLMNINGNLTRLESIIMFDGLSVGGDESRLPRAEKQKADSTILTTKTRGLITLMPKVMIPIDSGMMEMTTPYRNPAKISPKIMTGTEAGVETRRSSVRIRVSQGATIGLAEDAVKKSVIPTRPGKSIFGGISLPMEKARNRQIGKRMPNIRTGDLR